MNGMNDAFDNYMEMMLTSGDGDVGDFTETDADEEYGVYREDYTFKEDYLEPIDGANCSWRENYDYDFDLNIDPDDYETEEEYLEAIEEERLEKETKNFEKTPKAKRNSNKVYNFCKVSIDSHDKKYDYLFTNLDLKVGDRVIVPFGHEKTSGTVVAVGQCLECAFSCNINNMKMVVQLLDKQNDTEVSAIKKQNARVDKTIYEDDNLKISFVKWERKCYLAGGYAKAGTFIFENKSSKRLYIYMKDISVGGFLNRDETPPTILSEKQKEMEEFPFVYENKIPDYLNDCKMVDFKVYYGVLRGSYSTKAFIEEPTKESEIISLPL